MELVSGCVECGLAEPESLASLGGSAPGVVDGILSTMQQENEENGKLAAIEIRAAALGKSTPHHLHYNMQIY